MSTGTSTRRWRRLADRVVVLSLDDRFWLTSAVATSLCIYLLYLATHPYPAYGAGLYLKIAESISSHGYGLPATIPGYTAGGVPFAYPPLAFYLAAVVRDLTGVGAIAYSRFVPGLFVTATLVPYYFLATDLLGSPRRGGVATLLFAGTPAVLQWHLSAGGVVRGLAFLLAITGAAVGVRLFRTEDPRWLLPATALFGLTVLTHPTYAVFFGLSYLLLFAGLSRSPRGLLFGAVVASGGVVVATPWLLQVVATHGADIFLDASGTHGGLFGGPTRLLSEFVYPIDLGMEVVVFGAAYLGAAYALATDRYLLPAWLFAGGYFMGKPRFIFVAGAMLTALLFFEVGLPAIRRLAASSQLGRDHRRAVEIGAVALLVLSAGATGSAFAAGALDTHDGDRSQPAFIDGADREAMAWAAAETEPGADFVVLGDGAEWFPLFTDRTILVGQWGVEWTEPARYRQQIEQFRRVSLCDRAACITASLAASGAQPDYVYVPKGHYTVRGMTHQQAPGMRDSLAASDRYELVYENEGAIVARVTPSEPDTSPAPDMRPGPDAPPDERRVGTIRPSTTMSPGGDTPS
jgi:hypothetical protein